MGDNPFTKLWSKAKSSNFLKEDLELMIKINWLFITHKI